MEKKSLNTITLMNIISTVLLQGIAFLTLPIFSRLLGTDNYGIVSVYNTWTSIVMIVFTLQTADAFPSARIYLPAEEQEKFQSSAVSLALTSYLCFAVPTYIITAIIGIDRFLVVSLLIQGFTAYMISALSSKFIFEMDAFKNMLLSLFVSVVNVGLSLILIFSMDKEINYKGRIMGMMFSNLAGGVFSYFYIFRRGKTFYNKEFWKFTLPITLPTIFHSLANLVLAQSDRLMIDAMIDKSTTGIYSLAVTFTSVVSTIFLSLNNAWVPFYYKYSKENDKQSIMAHSRNYLELYTIIICGFMLLSQEVYIFFGGQNFTEGSKYIPLLAAGAFMTFLYSFPVNYEFYHKKTGHIAVVTVTAALCNIILNLILIGSMGVMGAVIATVISYVFQFAFHYISARFIIGGDFPYHMKMFLPWIAAVCCCCCVTYLLRDIWIVRWTFGAVLGAVCLYKIIRRKTIF